MPSVAEQLRLGREALKLDVPQVAEATKIRTDHIRALEAGEYDAFVAPVYIRGFVRSYATLLKLDVSQVMTDLAAELGRTDKFAEPPALTKQPKSWLDLVMLYLSRVDWRILVGVLVTVVLLVVAALVYRALHNSKTSDPLKNLSPGVHQTRSNSPAITLPLPRPAGR